MQKQNLTATSLVSIFDTIALNDFCREIDVQVGKRSSMGKCFDENCLYKMYIRTRTYKQCVSKIEIEAISRENDQR